MQILQSGSLPGAGRFAPSPTSDLHLGNLRTALLAWVFARAAGLRFLLRIEDLDQQRVQAAPAVRQRQIADLESLGIEWDPPVLTQSERFSIYRDAACRLDSYECFCTRAEIAQASQAPHGSYRPYPGTCAKLTSAQRDELRQIRKPAIRVRAESATFTVLDKHAGAVTGVVDDFVLFRADGTPSYNLASVVDDGLTGITQVTRGNDLLEVSPRQGWLATKLGFVPPSYIHVGLALNRQGRRLAKRDGAVTLADLTSRGLTTANVFHLIGTSLGMDSLSSAAELLENVAELCAASLLWHPWVVNFPI